MFFLKKHEQTGNPARENADLTFLHNLAIDARGQAPDIKAWEIPVLLFST